MIEIFDKIVSLFLRCGYLLVLSNIKSRVILYKEGNRNMDKKHKQKRLPVQSLFSFQTSTSMWNNLNGSWRTVRKGSLSKTWALEDFKT